MPQYYHITILDSCALTPLEFSKKGIAAPCSTLPYDSLKSHNQSQIFGAQASLTIPANKINTKQPLNISENWQPASAILILICLLCFAIYRYATTIRIVAKNIWSIETTLNMMENPSRELTHFIFVSKLMLIVALATLVTSSAIPFYPSLKPYFLPLTLAAIITISIISSIQEIANRTCGTISNSKPLFSNIRQLSNVNAAIAAYIITPTTIISALNPSALFWAAIPLIIIILFHVFRAFVYLKYEKFSFLQWFLYLCTVDLFPIIVPILITTLLPL